MITPRKLLTLKINTRLRKIALILQNFEKELTLTGKTNLPYMKDVISILLNDIGPTLPGYNEASNLLDKKGTLYGPETENLLRTLNTLRNGILKHLNLEPAEWDFQILPGLIDDKKRKIFPIKIFLDDIRSPFNLGSIFRSAESFGVSRILLSENCVSPEHPRAIRSAMGTIGAVPWERTSVEKLNDQHGVFALETGGTPVYEFSFPERGTMIIGSEELGVRPDLIKTAKAREGIVSIPTGGAKASLNVSSASAIALFTWYQKLSF